MKKYTLKVELTDEQARMIEKGVKEYNEWEKEIGEPGAWTVELELCHILENHLKELEKKGETTNAIQR